MTVILLDAFRNRSSGTRRSLARSYLKDDDLWKGEIRKRQVEKGAKRLPALFHVKHKQPLRWDRRFDLK